MGWSARCRAWPVPGICAELPSPGNKAAVALRRDAPARDAPVSEEAPHDQTFRTRSLPIRRRVA